MAFPTMNGKYPHLTGVGRRPRGFTFVELMVVMTIIALLLTIALPRYFSGLQRAKEAVLREDLSTMRDAIGHYRGDKGAYPLSLEILVEQKYLRFIPQDPLTERADTWLIVPPPDFSPGIYEIHSGAAGEATDGTAYADW
jgi:general secretion pathway protein G